MNRMQLRLVMILAGLAACAAAVRAAAESVPPPPDVELQHIDVTRVDATVSPCDNFYEYVCRTRNAEHPIPPDEVYWGVSGELAAWNRQVLRKILEANQPLQSARTPNQQKIGDFYASCMDQARSGYDDLTALDPVMAQIRAIRTPWDIAPTLAAIQLSFGTTWNAGDDQTNGAILGYGPQADYNDVGRVIAEVDQGGLGMPGRDFYLDTGADAKALRAAYRTLIVTLLELDGSSAAAARRAATAILRLETAMAAAQMDNVIRRDPAKINNRYTLEDLKALVPVFDWDGYLRGLGSPAVPLYEVSAPAYFKVLNQLLTSEPLEIWKTYLRFHLLESAASMLGNRWRAAEFAFHRVLDGQPRQAPDWRRCTEAVDAYLGEALGEVYVAQVFPPESKARAQKLVKDVEAAMGRDIDGVTWMQPATKREATLKLAAVVDKIGYPDKWIDYGSLTVVPGDLAGNVERATAFEFKRQLGLMGKPLDRAQWSMTPPTVNAYEDPQSNTINFPAGILQPVYFDALEDDAINYGAEGSVVGHELTHAFDDQGRKFDAHGNLRDWWTPEDARAFDQRGQCIAEEYSGPVPGVAGVRQNGKLTQGEDTADNGGIYLALSALAADLKEQGTSLDGEDAQGLSNLQRFFLAYGTSWCDQMRPEAARTLVLTNPHSVPELRVNNVLGNMPEFARAFSCKAGEPMVHPVHCRVW